MDAFWMICERPPSLDRVEALGLKEVNAHAGPIMSNCRDPCGESLETTFNCKLSTLQTKLSTPYHIVNRYESIHC